MTAKKKFYRMLAGGWGSFIGFSVQKAGNGVLDYTGNRTTLEQRLEHTRTNAGHWELFSWSFETTGISFSVQSTLTVMAFWKQP